MYFSYYLLGGILVSLLVHLLWKFWKLMKIYEAFPMYPLGLYYIYCVIFRKFSAHLPFTCIVFQNFVRVAQKFYEEGMVLVWIPKPHLVIFSEKAVQIFSNEKAAVNKAVMYEFMNESIFGEGLVTCNGEAWKKNRKLLNPVFKVGALKHTVSIFNNNAEILVKKLEEESSESSIELIEPLKLCVGSVICEYAMGVKLVNPKNKVVAEDALRAVQIVTQSFVHRFCHPWLHFKFMWKLVPFGRKAIKLYENCRNFIRQVILDAKESAMRNSCLQNGDYDECDRNRNSFADILLKHHLEDPNFSMKYIEDEVSTIIGAGYDTISHSLMWILFLLGHHPDVQEKIFDEVISISEGFIQYEDIHKLKYVECVIKETLRIYTPVPFYARQIDRDVQCGKYKVPKGTDIIFFPYMLHRDPAVYPDPEKFDPDRFEDGKMENRPWAYTPFSEGIRNCIGKRFGMMEMKVVLAHIIRRFRIVSLDKREDINLSWEIVLRPVQSPRMRLSLR